MYKIEETINIKNENRIIEMTNSIGKIIDYELSGIKSKCKVLSMDGTTVLLEFDNDTIYNMVYEAARIGSLLNHPSACCLGYPGIHIVKDWFE